MPRTIKLTEIVPARGMEPTKFKSIGIPIARIDRVEESSVIQFTDHIARDIEATRVVKVNGEYFHAREALDEVLALMNEEAP